MFYTPHVFCYYVIHLDLRDRWPQIIHPEGAFGKTAYSGIEHFEYLHDLFSLILSVGYFYYHGFDFLCVPRHTCETCFIFVARHTYSLEIHPCIAALSIFNFSSATKARSRQ